MQHLPIFCEKKKKKSGSLVKIPLMLPKAIIMIKSGERLKIVFDHKVNIQCIMMDVHFELGHL